MKINNLVEVHSHIIPGIDDGAKHTEDSLKMIAKLQEQGANAIILTPHYYSDNISYDDFLRRRDRTLNRLINALPAGSPRLIPAAEIYISNFLFNYDNINEACIGNSGYALIEHPFSAKFDDDDYNRLLNLYCDYGVKPILAHIERYKSLLNDKYKIDRLIDMGCLMQANISSFCNAPIGIRIKLFKLLESGRIHFVGSDCHNLTTRPPEFEKGITKIIKKSGIEAVEALMHNANELIR